VSAPIKALADQKRIDINDVYELLYRGADARAEMLEEKAAPALVK